MGTERYAEMFKRLAADEGAFVPFAMLGDPSPERSVELMLALADGGADALELGLPFSDPVADGPTIQAAASRVLAAGVTAREALTLVTPVRERHPELPIGLLVYANLVVNAGADEFYQRAAAAGVDSVLVADVPSVEAEPFCAAAKRAGIAPVLIATPNAKPAQLARIAALGEGYTYLVSRAGVTGTETEAQLDHGELYAQLKELGAAPPILGFGISEPAHVRAALAGGAAGAISGSAIVRRIAAGFSPRELSRFVAAMKAATRP